jgi:hypothetical protein
LQYFLLKKVSIPKIKNLNYLNCLFRFLFEKLKYSTRLSESLFLFEVIISVPIEKSLSLDTVDGGAQQTK